ncbi:MAG: hypothetical protein ACTS73_05125 [Arsenophonus sp. NEOnobi-MAG3]
MSDKEVIDRLQQLYENKVITYPHSDYHYLLKEPFISRHGILKLIVVHQAWPHKI